MNGDEALEAARRRLRVTDGRYVGKISELLGARWHYRGQDRAIIELDSPPGEFTVIPLVSLHVITQPPSRRDPRV